MTSAVQSVLVVRRSIHIAAKPARVWEYFTDFDRMNLWWGVIVGTPEAGTSQGQRLVTYQPRRGGHIEMEILFKGTPLRYGGTITLFIVDRELTFEMDWIPNQGWLRPTLLTLRLTPALGGTLVELMHHAFERTGEGATSDHAEYENGWGMTQLNALRKLATAP